MVVGPSNKSLELQAVIGFGGKVNNGLLITNDGETLIYALGSTIVLRSVMSLKEQEFLQVTGIQLGLGAWKSLKYRCQEHF